MLFAPVRSSRTPSGTPRAAQAQRRHRYPRALPAETAEFTTLEPVDALAVVAGRHQTTDLVDGSDLFSGLSELLEPASDQPDMPPSMRGTCAAKDCGHKCNWASVMLWKGASQVKCVVGLTLRNIRHSVRDRSQYDSPEDLEEAQRRVLSGGYVMLTDDFLASRPHTSRLHVPQFVSPRDGGTSQTEGRHDALSHSELPGISECIRQASRRQCVLFQRRSSGDVYGQAVYDAHTEEERRD